MLNNNTGFTLDTIIKDLPKNEQNEAIILMNKVMIMSDLLQGYALNFFSFINERDKDVKEIGICKKAKEAASICLSITKNISSINDEEYTKTFQNICDETDLLVSNVIYKYFQKAKNRKKYEMQLSD